MENDTILFVIIIYLLEKVVVLFTVINLFFAIAKNILFPACIIFFKGDIHIYINGFFVL